MLPAFRQCPRKVSEDGLAVTSDLQVRCCHSPELLLMHPLAVHIVFVAEL
jgi:hypothetical protein